MQPCITSCVAVNLTAVLTIGFNDSSYEVSEEDDIVTVCILLNFPSSESTTIEFAAIPGNASQGSGLYM